MVMVGKCLFTEIVVFFVCCWLTSFDSEDSPVHPFFARVGVLSFFTMIVTLIYGAWTL